VITSEKLGLTSDNLPAPAHMAAAVNCRFHDLRHFTASALIRYGASVKTMAHVLGHADEAETLRTYSHLWPDADTRTRAAVDAAFTTRADSPRTGRSSPPL
jgi:integrase